MGIINEGVQGQSKKNFVMSVDNDEDAKDEKIDDKYSAPSKSIPASDDDDKRDETTVKRESFLSVYKEGKDGDAADGNDEPDLSNGIRFKRDDEEDDEPNFELKTGPESSDGKRPLIQELDVTESKKIMEKKKAQEVIEAEESKEFDFETADRIELQGTFI